VTATIGGALADRLPWVFVSGYQGAVRRAFPELDAGTRWACLAASEDRERKFPGTRIEDDHGRPRLSGTKTWVAGSDHVGVLVVTAGVGAEHRIVAVDRDAEGVSIETYERAKFLGDLTQGRATFDGALALLEFPIPDGGRGFGAAEGLHVLTALNAFMLSHALRLGGAASLIGSAVAGVQAASAIAERELTDGLVTLGLAGLDEQTQVTAEQFEALIADGDPALHERWMTDRRLVGMYSAGINRYAEAVVQQARGEGVNDG
jgi:alkylation response protein AidB-like acyl-CoA dehydrogenase